MNEDNAVSLDAMDDDDDYLGLKREDKLSKR